MPRLEELIKASANIKTPSITLYLRYDAHGEDAFVDTQARQARLLAGKVCTVHVRDILFGRPQVHYEPYGQPIDGAFSECEHESVLRAEAHRLPRAREARNAQFGPPLDWVLRLPLSRKKMFEYGLTPAIVAQTVLRHYEGAVDVICSDNNEITMCDDEHRALDADALSNKSDGEGGFVRLRMHTYMALDALRSVLPSERHGVLDALERQTMAETEAKTQKRTRLPMLGIERRLCAASARAREIARKRRARRKSTTTDDSIAVTNSVTAPQTPRQSLSHDASTASGRSPKTLACSSVSRTASANGKSPVHSRGCPNGGASAGASPFRSFMHADDVDVDADKATQNNAEDHARGETNIDDAGGQAELRVEQPVDEIWGRLDATVCIPMLLERLGNDVRDLLLDGVEGVTDVTVREEARLVYDRDTGARKENAKEWLLETDGRNLRATFALRGIDHTRTRCNNPVEVARVLGIEAARHCLLLELRHVLQFDGAYVNYRHMALLFDIMTQSCSLMAINRHGLNKRQTGPLMRATLEESISMLVNAGCFSEFDPAKGPSERVAIGQPLDSGTGSHIATLVDNDALKRMFGDEPSHDAALSSDALADQIAEANSLPSVVDQRGLIDSSTTPFAPQIDQNEKRMLIDIQSYRRKAAESSLATQRQQRDIVGSGALQSKPSNNLIPSAVAAVRNPFETQREEAQETGSVKAIVGETNQQQQRKRKQPPEASQSADVRAEGVPFVNPFQPSTTVAGPVVPASKRRRTQTDTARLGDAVFRNPFAQQRLATSGDVGDGALAEIANRLYALDDNASNVGGCSLPQSMAANSDGVALRQPFYVPSSPSRFPK